MTGTGSPRLAQLALTYVAGRRARGEIGKRTAEQMRSRLLDFARSTSVPPERLTRRQVLAWMERPDLSPFYRRARLSALRSFCRWLVLEGHTVKDPTLGVDLPPLPDLMPRAFTDEERERIMLTAVAHPLRTRVALSFIFEEGLRRAEVAAVERTDIDWRDRSFLIRGKGGHGGTTDRLPLSTVSLELVERYCTAVPGRTGALLRSVRNPERGISAQRLGELVTAVLWQAGVKHAIGDGRSPHAGRHTVARELLDAEVDIRKVQKVLRHRSISSTQIYDRGRVNGLRSVIDRRNGSGEHPRLPLGTVDGHA